MFKLTFTEGIVIGLIVFAVPIVTTMFTGGSSSYKTPLASNRVRIEIGKKNSRTFSGLFTFFQDSFFIDSNSPNTAYTQDSFPIRDCKRNSPSSSLFLPNFSSAYCLRVILSLYPSGFPLCKVSHLTAFDSYYLNRTEYMYHGGTTAKYGTPLCFLLLISQFS